ncbi:MAG: hypothetical protein MJZ33_02900 [Paludibacteraceae bacterium]|nr:hypothetical protein [Paludibacteraceae bacterium]
MNYILNNEMYSIVKIHSHDAAVDYFYRLQSPKLQILDSIGENHFVIKVRDSLTHNMKYEIMFDGDCEVEDCCLMKYHNHIVFNNDKCLYLVDVVSKSVKEFETLAPLIGLTVTTKGELLLLKELGVDFIGNDGNIVRSIPTMFIENYILKDNVLFLKTENESFEIPL